MAFDINKHWPVPEPSTDEQRERIKANVEAWLGVEPQIDPRAAEVHRAIGAINRERS